LGVLIVIGVDLYTVHGEPNGLCNDTVGVYYVGKDGLGAGLMKNSECHIGAWAAYTAQTNTLTIARVPVSAGVTLGAIAGYRMAPLLPLLVPSIKVGIVRFSYLPRSPGAQSDGLHISIEFEQDKPASAGFFTSIKK
jgi:hypothetical protein